MKAVMILEKVPFAFETLTVSDADVSALTATYTAEADNALITVESNNIRFRIDGGDPTAAVGHLIVADGYQNLFLGTYAAIRALRMISVSGNATVFVTYYK